MCEAEKGLVAANQKIKDLEDYRDRLMARGDNKSDQIETLKTQVQTLTESNNRLNRALNDSIARKNTLTDELAKIHLFMTQFGPPKDIIDLAQNSYLINLVKELRSRTGCGLLACKKYGEAFQTGIKAMFSELSGLRLEVKKYQDELEEWKRLHANVTTHDVQMMKDKDDLHSKLKIMECSVNAQSREIGRLNSLLAEEKRKTPVIPERIFLKGYSRLGIS